jgi:hypothetical protein
VRRWWVENMKWCFLDVMPHKKFEGVFFGGDGMVDISE